jgi:hypothetical protein
MLTSNSFSETPYFSCFGLDPDTPEIDYEIHFVKTNNPGYIPPDAEAWPLYYHAAMDTLKDFPEAYNAVCDAVTILCEKLKGRRGLPPVPANSPRRPNEATPLPSLPDLGKRTY